MGFRRKEEGQKNLKYKWARKQNRTREQGEGKKRNQNQSQKDQNPQLIIKGNLNQGK